MSSIPQTAHTQTEATSNTPTGTLRTAPVQEVFSSFQGEGPWVGYRQLFVRFAHCHLKCQYCDTPMNTPDGMCHIETPPGSGQITKLTNPMSPETLLGVITPFLTETPHIGISFTGGEPLLYHAFLAPVFQQLQAQFGSTHPNLIYLETSGTQPEFLIPLLPWINVVAMDIKLPSATHEAPQFEAHQAFYTAIQAYNQTRPAHTPPVTVFAKVIFNEHYTEDEVAAIHQIVSDTNTPIMLQPETSLTDKSVHINIPKLFALHEALIRRYPHTRVIPQTHKMLQVL